ncbi:soluble scavenger receptor cysteine-rich domain-containing protein SSC5D isoform X2 [Mastomys coucha]|uniref:soluble scavenger receptor cysteine-rich domain-containing protein SSC5D isoform X2 n=1 Tax=Mastomys coucha TaxID=35658 RepID=UPI001262535E|nr:soluble scavenger receptor cysteine-rich domain-containing protein SSC5D isoform X2 [Mastomys coucha]
MRGLTCLLAMLVGIQAIERLRLADGPHGCAGRLEVWYSGRWGTVCDDGWDLRDAAVACRVLGCGGALAAPGGAFFGEGTGPVWLSELNCRGNEGQLGICPHRGWKAHICSHEEDAGIVCVGQRALNSREDSVSLLDGDPWLALSGELNPSSEEPPITHAPQPAASSQNGPRKKNPRPPKQTKSTRAPVLTNGAPRQERLRLVSGPHGCAGRLEVWHGGRWGTVCDDGWDLRDAAVACRELGCGGALAAPGGARFGPGEGPVWMDDVGCGGGEEALRDCPRSPWGRSNCDHTEDAGLVCTGPAPRLRLADGPHGCAGRLEVWHGGRWGSVCDDAWDLRDAAVACRELGCGGALAAPGGAFFGEGAGPIILDDLRCRGNETALRFCPSRPWGQHDCHHREDAGAVCDGMPLGDVQPTVPAADSNSTAPRLLSTSVGQMPGPVGTWPPPASPTAPPEPGPEAGSPQVRLVAGPSRCSGRLEVWHDGRWGTVCDDSWDMRDSAVVCRELGCGGPRQPDPAAGRFGWGAGPIWLDDVGCVGTEASLSECPAASWGKHNCAHNEDVGVTCTGTPGLDTISDPFSWSWLPGLGRDQGAWLPGELATKPASLTSSVLQKTTKAPGKAPKSTKKWVTKNAKRPTTQPPGMPTTRRSRVPGTPTSLNPTPRTSELPKRLTTEAPHRQASHTTVRLTPRVPWEWTSETVMSLSTQEVTSKATTTQAPQTSLEPSGETPEGSVESSQDPAATPTAEVPVPSGYTGDDDYPSWTWDPTSGEDLAKGTAVAAWPGHTLSWATTTDTEVLSPATQSPPDTDDQGRYEPSWTWDTPSRRGLSKETPTTTKPGSTVTTSTSESPGHPSPAPRARADTGSPRKPKPERRPLPTSAHTTSSPASSASPEPPGSQQTSGSRPQLIPDSSSKQEGTSSPPKTSPPTPGLPFPATSALSTPDASLLPTHTPEHSGHPTSTSSEGLTSDSSMLSEVSSLSPTSELTPGSDTTPGLGTAPEITPESSDSSDLLTSFRTPTQPFTASHPTSTPHPTTIPQLNTTTPYSTMTPHPTTNPQHPRSPHPTTSPQPPINTHPSPHQYSPTPATSTESLPYPLETELSSPTSQLRGKPSLQPELTLVEATPTDTSQMQNLELFLASESVPSRPSPAPSIDPLSTEVFKSPRSQTLHSAPDPMVTPDLPISSVAHPSDQPSPDHLTQGPTLNHNPGPFGPCVSPVPPVRVMACEPPALVELVAAVREVGDQLQKLTWALEQDRQERQVLGLGLVQLVEAAQGLGQMSETVKRLAEVAWPPSTPVPMTTTTEEEERPLRGDV